MATIISTFSLTSILSPTLSPTLTLNLQHGLFYFFATMGIVSALMVIVAKNPVRSVLSLILTFFAMGSLWILLDSEFLAMTLVLVYVGAVMVLFLFVIMMLDIDVATLESGFTRYLPLGLFVSVLVGAGIIYAVGPQTFGLSQMPLPEAPPPHISNVTLLGTLLYTNYLYPFELAGILLLIAIISAISLTFRGKQYNKAPEPSKQLEVRKEDRIRLVSMNSAAGRADTGDRPYSKPSQETS